MTYSFPCTDLSVAGKLAGMEKGSNTRSSLLWEVERLLSETKELPKILIMENVPQVLNASGWRDWIYFLEKLGYNNYADILNAADYGIPQHRERCFMVSILGNYQYKFPKRLKLKYYLKSFLEDEVDEHYFLTDAMINYFIKNTEIQKEKGNGFRFNFTNGNGIAKTITTRSGGRMDDNFILDPKCIQVGNLTGGKWEKINESCRRIYDEEGFAPCIDTMQGGNRQPKFLIRDKNENIKVMPITSNNKRIKKLVDDTDFENKETAYLDVYNQKVIDNLVGTLSAGMEHQQRNIIYNNLRIRKLTPRECFRIMGVKDIDSNKITCSNSQKYKQAGNSIVTTCLMAIYSQLFENVNYKEKIEQLVENLVKGD